MKSHLTTSIKVFSRKIEKRERKERKRRTKWMKKPFLEGKKI